MSRAGAPQLTGLLSIWEEVQTFPEVVVPASLLQELNTVWALLPPPVVLPKWAAERKEEEIAQRCTACNSSGRGWGRQQYSG